MFQDAGAELAGLGRQALRILEVDEGVPPRLAVDQADVEMAAAARRGARGLRHECREIAFEMGHLLHRIAECEGLVGRFDAHGGAVDDLELRAGVFAVVGDHIDADGQ